MATTFTSACTALAPYVDNGVNATDTTRTASRVNEAQRRLIDQYNFLIRREELKRTLLVYAASPTDLILDNIDATKVMILSLWREENNELEMAASLEKKALDMVERDILQEVETERRDTFQALETSSNQNTFGGLVGRIGLETFTKYKSPVSRVASYVNQAYQTAIDQYNFLVRGEELNEVGTAELTFVAKDITNTTDNAFIFDLRVPIEVIRGLSVSLMMMDAGAPVADAIAMKTQAVGTIGQNVVAAVEKVRRVVTGDAGRLHNELPDGLKFPTARLTTLLTQASTEAAAQLEFLQRREELDGTGVTLVVSFEVKKKLVESYLATSQAAVEIATATKQEAFALIERDVVAAVEKLRKVVTGDAGRLHNELPDGLKFPTARLTTLLTQASTEAAAQLEFLQRREELDGTGVTLVVSFEVKKKLVESYLATSQAAVEIATATKQEAFALIERDVVAAVEKLRKVVTGDVGRLHNELVMGLKVPTARMTKLLNQAVADIIAHQSFLQRADDDIISPPPATFEQKKLLVESYLFALDGNTEAAMAVKKSAFELIERDYTASTLTSRRDTRMALSLGSPSSFGYYWGRIGLGFDEALNFTNESIKRAVTGAEESLMNSGKWVGTVAEYTFTVSNSGDVFLPREVETVLFATFDGDPRPVHDRFAEYMRGGTGIKTEDSPWRSGFSDRGEAVDPADSITKRKYFVSVPQENQPTLVRYLAKRRFVPHIADTDSMYLSNYEAVSQAAMAIMSLGKIGSFDAARKLLADQMAQQYFKSQIGGAHNKRVFAMR